MADTRLLRRSDSRRRPGRRLPRAAAASGSAAPARGWSRKDGRIRCPEAAFKVGESSVEIGAHYFQKRLGLEPHLRTEQLEKLGLRYFFYSGRQPRPDAAVSSSARRAFPVPSFQLDRGDSKTCSASDRTPSSASRCFDGWRVKSIALDSRTVHRVCLAGPGGIREMRPAGSSTQAAARPAQAPARAGPAQHARANAALVACAVARQRSTTGRDDPALARARCRRASAGRAPST